MRRKLLTGLTTLLLVTGVAGTGAALVQPAAVYADTPAADGSGGCNDHLLTFPAWYRGLTNSKCDIKSPSQVGGLSKFIMIIVFNIVEILLQAAAYVSVVFIIYGGIKFIIDAGAPDSVVRARKTVLNAVIGLVISMMSIGIVNLIVGRL